MHPQTITGARGPTYAASICEDHRIDPARTNEQASSNEGRIEPPSGRQVELRFGDQRAVVVEVGGGLREYTVAGNPVLDGYAEDRRCRSGRGQILAPWPNRLKDGSYEWEDQTLQLALSEAPRSNAIHGLVRFVNWAVAQRSDCSVTMTYLLHPQDGYPFTLALEVAYTLDQQGLSVQTRATNLGEQACPYGVGAHPYLTAGADCIDECILQVPAAGWMPADERGIPTGEIAATAGGRYDFVAPRPIGATRLDTCFCELRHDADGRARVRLVAPDGARAVTLWMDGQHRFLMLFTGDTLPEPDRRRRSIAVEPMTCAPNAFRSGSGLKSLQAGESFTCAWGIQLG
ncbi:MAG TPA: aldose 1-epimerase family protein [Solirubrobacteraceae bacterium]|jgi:aldose 1-epimerase|nr:aldose 1-epimerase family protein [Solirubrobacteraceae bacterium]